MSYSKMTIYVHSSIWPTQLHMTHTTPFDPHNFFKIYCILKSAQFELLELNSEFH